MVLFFGDTPAILSLKSILPRAALSKAFWISFVGRLPLSFSLLKSANLLNNFCALFCFNSASHLYVFLFFL